MRRVFYYKIMDIFEDGKKVAEEAEKPDTTSKSTDSEPNEEVVRELKMRPIREYFGTQSYNDDKLEEIIKWANPKGKLSQEEVLEKIKHISSTVGEASLGETELEKVWKFIKIYKSFTSLVEKI